MMRGDQPNERRAAGPARRWIFAFVVGSLLAFVGQARSADATVAADGVAAAAVGAGACCALPAAIAQGGLWSSAIGFFDNYGLYMPRIHCLRTADGSPDWPWISLLIALNAGVVVGYVKIFRFWRASYLAEAPRDRNGKLMDLAHIFLWCAICGYALAILMFWWPAYRLNAVALGVLNFFTWRFARNLSGLRVSLSAFRLQRELQETMSDRTDELARLVAERTAELERAQAAAIAADRAKTDFLAQMSHEIRTPMTAILGFTQLLVDRPPKDEAQRQKYLHIVRQNGQHLLAVINDVLDMARIEAGLVTVEHIDCELPALLREVETLWGPKATEKGLVLALRIEAGVPRTVQTDPTRLRQILFNLVGNAIKFTQAGGVRIEARPDVATGRTLIDVIDTGIGMSDEQVGRLFTRFAQADETTPRKFGGSGLGLAISKRLLEMLGGTIAVRSTPAEGSQFTVSLPFAPVDGAAACAATEIVPPPPNPEDDIPSLEHRPMLEGVRLLVADDAADNRDLLRFLFERAGAAVEFANDGRDAVDLVSLAPDRYDVILMDMHMPRLDGYAATTTLRRQGVTRPIVAVTANSMIGDRERCLAAGCDAYVAKPIDPDELLAVVDRLATTCMGEPVSTAAALGSGEVAETFAGDAI